MPQSAMDFLNAPDPGATAAPTGGGDAAPSQPSAPTAMEFLEAPDKPQQPQPKGPPPGEGLSFADKAALSAHDNIAEREMYLQKLYGKEAVRKTGVNGKDKLYLRKDGREIEIPEDFGFLADVAGHLPEMGAAGYGAVEGGAMGAALGPIGAFAGAVIGSGIGALGGYAAKQVGKQAAGTYNKTTSEAIEGGLDAYEGGALGEIGGQAVGKVAKKVLSGNAIPRWMSGATDESVAKAEKAWAGGARPPYVSVAPDSRKLARIELDAEKLTGKYAEQDKRNQQFVLGEVQKTLQDQGVPKAHLDGIMGMLQDPNAPAFSGRDAGEVLQKGIQAHVETLEHHITQAAATSDKLIDTRLANIDRMIDAHPAGLLADDTADMIKNAKQQFSTAATDVYEKIHNSLGGARVVPTSSIREAAKQITAMLPKTSIAGMVKEMSQLAQRDVSEEDAVLLKEFGIDLGDDKISLRDAQRMRTVLSERGGATDLTRNTVKGDHLAVARAVDDAIQEAGQDPQAAHAIAALNKADSWYKQNIVKFKDSAIKNLVKQTRSGMPPDPQRIVNIIASPGYSARVNTIKSMVGDAVWKRVQSTHIGMVLQGATSVGEHGGRLVDGMKLIDHLAKPENRSVFNAVHGQDGADSMMEIGRMLASRKGTLSPEVLTRGGDVKTALTTLRNNEKLLDDYLENNLLGEMRDPKRTGEDVFRWAVEPGKESRIMAVAKQFGQNSPQMAELRQAGLEMLARNASIQSIKKNGSNAIKRELSQFTQNQRDLLFPNGMYDDLKALSETIEFIFPYKEDVGMAGMHANAILEAPLLGGKHGFWAGRLAKQLIAGTMRFVVLHPAIARTIVTGRNQDTHWIVRAANILKQIAKADIINNGLPEGPEVQNSDPQKAVEIHQANEMNEQPEGGDGANRRSGQNNSAAQSDAGGSRRGKIERKATDNRPSAQGAGT